MLEYIIEQNNLLKYKKSTLFRNDKRCIQLFAENALLTRPSETNTADHRVTDVRQGLFSVDEFRYLNVPRVGIFSVHDDLECIMRCLQHPSCISVNLALEIRLWCELLSFDKYSNSREFKQNESSHHYHIVVRLSFVFFKFQSSLPKETQSTISCMA